LRFPDGFRGSTVRTGAVASLFINPAFDSVTAHGGIHALPMQTDRWIEMDLFFFKEKPFRTEARALLERLAPLYREVEGDHGIMLCCAWLCDLVTEWNGAPGQTLPFRSPTMAAWAGYSYEDLQTLIHVIKDEAAQAGFPHFKVGVMMVGWGKFDWGEGGGYDLQSGWYDRHPELYFTDFWKNLDYRKRLKADTHPYASQPQGITEGMSFATFFSGQWALLSRFLGINAVHFRDGFLGPAIYEMVGPFGEKGPRNPADYDAWSRELVAFFTAAKAANPACLVMAYSSARSAVGEYRVGCFDLEALVASGGIDVWIDQTWAGAWQDWWTHEFRGWTFQLANVIAHHAMVVAGNRRRATPCRHYHLIETWDAWEPWDTLHQTPMKLRWGMWAFSHAAVATSEGLSRTTTGEANCSERTTLAFFASTSTPPSKTPINLRKSTVPRWPSTCRKWPPCGRPRPTRTPAISSTTNAACS
jgi:hypothetical protein